jgi:benzoyl-CoA-dihydrodiol lyase
LWILKTEGDAANVLAVDELLDKNKGHWFVRETLGFMRRTLARIDVSSRSLFALIEPGSCFAGTLAELAFAADRAYMLDSVDEPNAITLSTLNFGAFPMVNDLTRIDARFYENKAEIDAVKAEMGKPLTAADADRLGLVTATPDDLDWDHEVRIAIEERASMSPDALTGLEANLRFGPKETMNTRIFGRLSAWQNWIFFRPNAVGSEGALKLFGSGKKAQFDWNRV